MCPTLQRILRYFTLLIATIIICAMCYVWSQDNIQVVGDVYLSRWAVTKDLRQALKEFKHVYNRWKRSPGQYTRVKTILYWNKMYAEKHRYFMFGSGDVFRGCPVPHCYATPERDLLNRDEGYDAVLLHGIEIDLHDLPTSRREHQKFIYFSWESPISRPIYYGAFVQIPNYYNWTMSYRLDSDIQRPYGKIRDLDTGQIIAPPAHPDRKVPWRKFGVEETFDVGAQELEIVSEKQRIAAWFVSHCNTNSKREMLVEELEKFFEVDIYGSCGNLQCDKANPEECYDLLERDYFFYFAFENTLCKDYVTEKFFLPLKKYVVPVVYGGADYTKFAPPHSYINILDFKTIADLAYFLISLSKNPAEYSSYFWWKKFYTVEDSTKSTLCDLCEKLHNDDLPKKTLANFEEYYTRNQCYQPDNLNWLQSVRHH